jgi:predicted outer membrane protein
LRKELRDYAQKNNIMLTDMDTTNIIDINYKPGIDWDEEWADEVNDDHKRLVNRFERAERRIKEDAALKNIISSTLPVLESHRDAAKKLEDRLEKR